ncbi:MAG: c-type cytochrome [Bdellovibrionales bacterium]|nr:c-type cytochrome [Bdellovibrionales bacterium]
MAERDELLDHNYDGIQEYDNDLPKWWIWLFVLTLMYGAGYIVYRHGSAGMDQESLLAREMEKHEALRAEIESKQKPEAVGADALLALVSDASAVERGKAVFAAKCAVCHGAQAQGLVGPNLTDDYWLHGGAITDVHSVVVNGVVEKGMQSWKGFISDQEIGEVVAFIWTLHGSNPPDPKKPQGDLVPRSES